MSIRLEHVSKSYKSGHDAAVDDVSLEVRDGEFMVLVGPSGCGKSTLLKLIAGIEDVSDGHIFIGDREVTLLDPRKRDIAMVFQNYALYPHLSVRGNLGFGLKLRKVSRAERARRVMGYGQDLETKRQHVGEQAGFDDLVGIDAFLLAMREALGEETLDGAQGLQEAADAEIIKCDGHYVSS